MKINQSLLLVVIGVLLLFFTNSVIGCPSPNVTALSVTKGLNSEVVNLTISGSKFHKSTYIKLTKTGETDIIGENVRVISATQVTCSLNLKGKAVGQWDVVVGNIGTITKKEKPTLISKGFLIEYPGLTLAEMEPGQANVNTTTEIKVSGSGFRGGIKVMLSNNQMDIGASEVNMSSPESLTCEFNLTGAAVGTYNLKAVNDDGKTGLLVNAFEIVTPVPDKKPAPIITEVSPTQGSNDSLVSVTINGGNIDPQATVKLHGVGQESIPGVNIKFESAARICCNFDISAKPAGQYHVTITNPDNQSDTLKDGFTISQFIPKVDPNQSIKPVFFEYDNWELHSDQLETINANIDILRNNPKMYILLGGHADERGTREYNLELSAKRSETVKKHLMEHGIPKDYIVIYAYGKDYPAKKGPGEDNWSYNRRVDILLFEDSPPKDAGIINPVEGSPVQ